ncbi:type II toxin-antitoxin system RelE/ParE family toxin [Oceanihabitans sp. IOP_32]|uniref:type II toxin-antitoxin system RelE/ParE family toxin n=1 Tax=Oceanihabitans sp. IOP_32 TaxID=2529032 RepID=UPI001D1714CE|nr:type II toxin-antitoxin system RelE/ParE family toxin [Oceanihabitans sp. IOP_32]
MAKYKLTNEAKNDLIRNHHDGVEKFGMKQADKYFDSIAERPFSFDSVDYIKKDIDDAYVELTVFTIKSMKILWQ